METKKKSKVRISTQDIAEVLVSELHKIEKHVVRLEDLTDKPLKIDHSDFDKSASSYREQALSDNRRVEEIYTRLESRMHAFDQALDKMNDRLNKTLSRQWNYLLVLLAFLFLLIVGSVFIVTRQSDTIDRMKTEMKGGKR